MENYYKTLVFTDRERSVGLGRYAHPIVSFDRSKEFEWAGGALPLVLSPSAEMKMMAQLYPGLDLRRIKLIEIKITEVP